jgi:curved DNA-binding protein CbpA
MNEAYSILGLEPGASDDEVNAAYRRMVRRYPPELNPRRFARIKQAHELLSSYERRMREAQADLERAIEMLYPPVTVTLVPPPEPPPPLTAADWRPLLRRLREQAILEALKRDLVFP